MGMSALRLTGYTFCSFSNLAASSGDICMALAVHLAKNDVNRADAGDDIGDDLAFHDFWKRLQIDERRRTEVAAERFGRTVAGDEASEFSARRFDCDVGLAGCGRKSFGENLEVIDERFHLRLH